MFLDDSVNALKAAADPTRLRLLATPKDLWVAVLVCLKRVLQIALVATWLRQRGIGVVRL